MEEKMAMALWKWLSVEFKVSEEKENYTKSFAEKWEHIIMLLKVWVFDCKYTIN